MVSGLESGLGSFNQRKSDKQLLILIDLSGS